MAYIRIKNWEEYQHYKDRMPPWIKLHNDLLSSRTWVGLADSDRVLAIACMLLASRTENKIPHDLDYIRRVAYLNSKPDLTALIQIEFVEIVGLTPIMRADASTSQAFVCPEAEQSRDRGEAEQRQRATRIPQNFSVTDAHRQFAIEHKYPDPDSEIQAFKDHFAHKPGKDGTSLDWNARFRVWLKKASEMRGSNGNTSGYINRGRARQDAQRAELERAEEMDSEGAFSLSGNDERDGHGGSLKRLRGTASGSATTPIGEGVPQGRNNPEILPKAGRTN